MNASFDLRELDLCFEGIVPGSISTCSRDGTPNISFVSHVHRADSRHVATSFQFFSKTRQNLIENPQACIRLLNPDNLQSYLLKVRYVRSEFEGPLFDSMSLKLKIIASHEGMSEVFALKAADVYEVLGVHKVPECTSLQPRSPHDPCATQSSDLEILRAMSDRLVRARDLEELFDRAHQLMDHFFGYKHMIFFLIGEDKNSLLASSSYGYPESGVGSEIAFGEGIIGLTAQYGKLLQMSGVNLGLRYGQAARNSLSRSGHASCLQQRIPLPGLPNPASQIAVPMFAGDELQGVLVIESGEKRHWLPRDQNLLSILLNQIGASVKALKNPSSSENDCSAPPIASVPPAMKTSSTVKTICFVEKEETLFIDESYLIRNLPAKVLWHLLKTHSETGRDEFSNIELRSLNWLNLPGYRDNLEARLILLKKRLQAKCPEIRIVATQRGRFRLEVGCQLELKTR